LAANLRLLALRTEFSILSFPGAKNLEGISYQRDNSDYKLKYQNSGAFAHLPRLGFSIQS